MSDLSEQQMLMADSAAGVKQEESDREKSRLRDFMDSLFRHVSDEDRILLMLKEVEGLSLKELEQIYHVKENALKVRLFRARQRVLKAYNAASEAGNI